MPEGSIVPCNMYGEKVLGNILKDDVFEIWEKDEFINKFRDLDRLEGKCANCEVINCNGCRFYAQEITGNFYAQDPYCVREDLMR